MTFKPKNKVKSTKELSAKELQKIATEIENRILNLVVGVPYGIEKLIKLMDVVITDSIPTACVPVGKSPKIYINPHFVEQHCDTEEKLFVLILHELHHILLGHTRLYKRVTPQHNLAFDAIINAMLSRMNPEPHWTALFREYYQPNAFPFYFLRPPEGFPNKGQYPASMPKRHKEILHQLYYKNGGSFHEIFHLLSQEIQIIKIAIPMENRNSSNNQSSSTAGENSTISPGEGEQKGFTTEEIVDALLGNHDADERGHEYHDNPEIFTAIRAIVERWPQPNDPLVGRSLNDIKSKMKVDIIKPLTPVQSVKKAIIAASDKGIVKHQKGKMTKRRSIQQVYPSKDRRAFALSAAGHSNLLYRKKIPYEEFGINPVHIYIDVSGSMDGFIPDIISAVISCKKWVNTEIYTFSNGVEKTDLKALQNGEYTTTRGTDIIAVTKHWMAHKFKNVVLLTDGYVGPPAEDTIAFIQKTKFHVVLTKNGLKSDLEVLKPKFHIFQS
jgi:predicted metal-dependent peptidase